MTSPSDDIAINADTSQSDNGWGGGWNKADITDGLRSYDGEWARGLAFWYGEWHQATIDFGHQENEGAPAFIGELEEALRTKTYKPNTVKWVMIPKSDGSQRSLGIPTIRDRVAQMAAKLVIEPIPAMTINSIQNPFRVERETTFTEEGP